MDSLFRNKLVRGLSFCGLVSTSLFTTSTYAGLIEHRLYDGQADGLVYVGDLNQEWLNFQFTTNMTQSDALASYSVEGFRVAEMHELTDLFDAFSMERKNGVYEADAGLDSKSGICEDLINNDPLKSFDEYQRQHCTHNNEDNSGGAAGYTDALFNWFSPTRVASALDHQILATYQYDPSIMGFGSSHLPLLWAYNLGAGHANADRDYLYMMHSDQAVGLKNAFVSTFLVRDVPAQSVPEPGTLALLLGSLFALRRKLRN